LKAPDTTIAMVA